MRMCQWKMDCCLCSYIALIAYYLSHARWLSKIFKPAEIPSDVFKKNNYIPVIENDSDEN